MTDKAKPRKRRAVSKARLYKEILASTVEHFNTEQTETLTVADLLDAIKDDIVDEALK